MPRRRALAIGAKIGEAFYYVDQSKRRVALANLARAFPERSLGENETVLRRSCRNLGRMLAEVCHFRSLTAGDIDRYITIDDRERWTSVVEDVDRQGRIMLTAHFGNFELLAHAHGLLGYPVTLAHRTMRNPLVDRLILDLRAGAGSVSVPKKSAARALLRALRDKKMIALLADQNQTANAGVFADFFGIPACTTTGPAWMAHHTGAPIVPIFIVREGESERHRVVFLPDIEVADTGDRAADIQRTTERCNGAIEEILRKHPDHWIWFHKRWRTRPPGEKSLY